MQASISVSVIKEALSPRSATMTLAIDGSGGAQFPRYGGKVNAYPVALATDDHEKRGLIFGGGEARGVRQSEFSIMMVRD